MVAFVISSYKGMSRLDAVMVIVADYSCSAAQAWNRSDSRAAKALSLRGQSENNLMREAHREAARILYEERNKDSASDASKELYVDLHGRSHTIKLYNKRLIANIHLRPPSR